MSETYYRLVSKKVFESLKKDFLNDKTIGLSKFISALGSCKSNSLSTFLKDDSVDENIVLTSLIFIRDSLNNNYYIKIPESDIVDNGFSTNNEQASNLSYTLGRTLHRNICGLTISNITSLLKMFSDKNVHDIDYIKSKELALIALKGEENKSFIDRNEIKEKSILIDLLIALQQDDVIFHKTKRMELIEEFNKIYDSAMQAMGEEYFNDIFDPYDKITKNQSNIAVNKTTE